MIERLDDPRTATPGDGRLEQRAAPAASPRTAPTRPTPPAA